MLLSMFVSFFLARMLRWKIYLLLMSAILVLVSVFSIGVPYYESKVFPFRTTSGVLIENPIPLSFPFYATLYQEIHGVGSFENYRLNFLAFTLLEYNIWSEVRLWGSLSYNLSWADYVLFLLVFSLGNFVGAIIGYWINITTLKKKKMK